MSRAKHVELLNLIGTIAGKFLLSGYPSELYDTAAKRHGWCRHEFEIVNNASGKKQKDVEVECIWTNYA
jgi:DNA adenine methylase